MTSAPADTSVTPTSAYRDIVRAMAAVQKPSKGAPAYSRFVNRKLGRLIAAAAFRIGLTPNIVTGVSAFFSFAAIALICLVAPHVWLGIAVALGLVLGYAFDAADGQLARLQGGGSPSGEWLDHMVDAAKIVCLHLAVLISYYRFIPTVPRSALLIPLGFTVVAVVMFFGMMLNDQLRRQQETRTGRPVPRGTATSSIRSLLVIPTDYGLLCVVFVLLGWPLGFFWVYAALFVANAGFMALASFKWFNDMKALT